MLENNVYSADKLDSSLNNHLDQPEKAQHFSLNCPVAQELLVGFIPVPKSVKKSPIKIMCLVRIVLILAGQLLPASHVRDIAILNGGDSLELAVIPHWLLKRQNISAL